MNLPARIGIVAAALGLAASAPAMSAPFAGYVQTPSQNILCAIDQGTAWCSIGSLRKEVWIKGDGSYRVTGRSNADIGDVQIRTLTYGRSVRGKNITCTSRVDGMRCVSQKTGRGALMSRAGVQRIP